MAKTTRREFLQIAGVGGVVFASGLLRANASPGQTKSGRKAAGDFYFVQLSDTHWGYKGPANPEATVELPRAVELVNALPTAPDFVVFTGDLTHTTDDDQERRRRLAEFRERLKPMRAPMVRLMAGRTTIMIAHRLNTLDGCHLRLQIERGEVVDRRTCTGSPRGDWWPGVSTACGRATLTGAGRAVAPYAIMSRRRAARSSSS